MKGTERLAQSWRPSGKEISVPKLQEIISHTYSAFVGSTPKGPNSRNPCHKGHVA